ncbi:MAG: tetratricopeptide repeat protein [Janthinobacterium lividum]
MVASSILPEVVDTDTPVELPLAYPQDINSLLSNITLPEEWLQSEPNPILTHISTLERNTDKASELPIVMLSAKSTQHHEALVFVLLKHDNQREYATAWALNVEGLAIHRRQGEQKGITAGLNNLGLMTFEQGDYAATRILHEESLTIQRLLGNPSGIAYSLLNLGSVSSEQGDPAAARTSYEESLTIFQELGDRLLIANSLNGLEAVTSNQGDFVSSLAFYAESITIQYQLGDLHGIAYGLEGMADVARGQGQPTRAARLVGAAAVLRENIGSPLPTPGQKELEKP